VRELLPDEAETLLKGRFAIIQVWRAINQRIQSNPLASRMRKARPKKTG
jgi:hypothetical protein